MTIQTSPLVAFGGAGASPNLSPILPVHEPAEKPEAFELGGVHPWAFAPAEVSFTEEFKARFTLKGAEPLRPLFMEPYAFGVSPFLKNEQKDSSVQAALMPSLPLLTASLSPIFKAASHNVSFEINDELRLLGIVPASSELPRGSGHISPELILKGGFGHVTAGAKEPAFFEEMSDCDLNKAFLEESH